MSSLVKGVVAVALFFGAMAYAIAADVRIMTYYPTPFAVYRQLTVLDNAFLVTQAGAGTGVMIGSRNAPGARLEVVGSTRLNGRIRITGGGPQSGKVLTAMNGSGDATWQWPPPGCVYWTP